MGDNVSRAFRLTRRTCLDFDGPPCSPDSLASDLLGTAPGTSLFKGSPLERDRLSRLMLGEHPRCNGPLRTLSFTGFPGPYRATVKIPEGCYTAPELDEIRMTILRLNYFAKVPVVTFECERQPKAPPKNPDITDIVLGSYYWVSAHTVVMDYQPVTSPHVSRIDGTLSTLVHETAHAINRKEFWKDRDWKEAYYRSLAYRNYEIIDDSNYLKDTQDSKGHPHENADEAFASSVNAYFLHADQFASYIQNEKTAPSMRIFGKLVWTYMRDRVFRGFVFTKDDVDPFAGEEFQTLLERLPGRRESLIDFFRHEELDVRRDVAFNLNFYWHDRNPDAKSEIPALIIAGQDVDNSVRNRALQALMHYGPDAKAAVPTLVISLRHEDPETRLRAAMALGNIGPEARTAAPVLQTARRDPDPEVAEAARKALKEILPH